jgi:DNA-binding winged helix-turn-helix (wHTH) protein
MRDVPESGGSEPLGEAAPPVRFAGLVLDLDACTLARESGEAIPLTRGEFTLLRVFVTRPGRVVSRDTLLDALANRRFEPFDRSVDVLIGRLRRKIEPDRKEPRLIVTVPGEGYRFDGLTKTPLSDPRPSIVLPAPENDERDPEGDPGSAAPQEVLAHPKLAAGQGKSADGAKSTAAQHRFGFVPFAAAIALVLLATVGSWFLLGGRLTNPPPRAPPLDRRAPARESLRRSCPRLFRRRRHRKPHRPAFARLRQSRHRAQHRLHLQGQKCRRQKDRQGARGSIRARRLGTARPGPAARQCAAHRHRDRRAAVGRRVRRGRGRSPQGARPGGRQIGSRFGSGTGQGRG